MEKPNLADRVFRVGLAELEALYNLRLTKENVEIWYRNLCDLDNRWFIEGIKLFVRNEKCLYPNTSVVFLIREYARTARENELATMEKEKEPWEIERYRAICIETQKTREASTQRLLGRRPELRELIEKTGLCITDKRRLL